MGLLIALVVCTSATPVSALSPTSDASHPPAAVSICGLSLCVGGKTFVIRGATVYGAYSDANTEIALVLAGLNTLELGRVRHSLPRVVGHDVIGHMGSGRQVHSRGQGPWAARHLEPFRVRAIVAVLGMDAHHDDLETLTSFVADRKNTADGLIYKDDSTIAMVELFGEICHPGDRGHVPSRNDRHHGADAEFL